MEHLARLRSSVGLRKEPRRPPARRPPLVVAAVSLAAALMVVLPASAGAVGTIVEIPLAAGTVPRDLTISANGNAVQFPESGTGTLGNVSEKNRYSRYSLPLVKGQPTAAVVGAGGDVWITETAGNAIEQWKAGHVHVFKLPAGSQPRGIAAASKAVWFTEAGTNMIGRLTPTGFLTQYRIPTPHSGAARITIGPDGGVWFTEQSVDRVGRLDPSTGQITELALAPGSHPFGIATGPDGNVWVTESGTGKVAVISPPSFETAVEYAAGSHPLGIAAGTDGLMWVADQGTNSIISLGMDGTATAYPVPTPNAGLLGITTGPQGQVWFSESAANRIGRLPNTQPHTQYVSVGATVVEPDPPRLQLGSTVQWTFFGPGLQSATDDTGMGLYDSGPLPFVSFFSHAFTAAGDYAFHSTTSSLGGVIKVLPQLSAQTVAAGAPVTVTWATGPAPAGFHYEVQVRRPGHGNFIPWQTNASGPSAAYTTSAAGTYVFEARLVDTATSPQTSSDWSPPVTAAAS